MAEFDSLSSDYKEILDRDVRFFGEGGEYFARYKAEYVCSYLGNGFNGRILDYGCGIGIVAGFLGSYFSRDHVSVMGYDISADSITEARKNVSGVSFTNNFDELHRDHFDVIIMANVLHHVKVSERCDFLAGVLPTLKKGGRLFVFEHNPYNPLTQLVVRMSLLDKTASLIDMKGAAALLETMHMIIKEKKYIVFFPKILKRLRFMEPGMGNLPVGGQYVCVGEKV